MQMILVLVLIVAFGVINAVHHLAQSRRQFRESHNQQTIVQIIREWRADP